MVVQESLIESAVAGLQPMWVELSFLVFFALGFALLRLDGLNISPLRSRKRISDPKVKPFNSQLKQLIDADAGAGNVDQASMLTAWRAENDRIPTLPELLRPVVQALVDTSLATASEEIIDHMRAHSSVLGNSRVGALVLDVVARAGRESLMTQLWDEMQTTLHIVPSVQTYEVILGGFATLAKQGNVSKLLEEMESKNLKLSPRGYLLIMKGFLKHGLVDAVLPQMKAMRKQNYHVPPFAVCQLARVGCDSGRVKDIFEAGVSGDIEMTSEAVAFLLEDCAKRADLDLGRRVEAFARESKLPFVCSSYDALLKLYTAAGDQRAPVVFMEMQGTGIRISEGLCVGLLARCAETKFLRFAQDIACFVRSRGGMSIAVYSALMKVYAYCGMYDQACDLYEKILEDGLEPDAMMYGCLIKFSVECGRTRLSRELSERAPSLDIQNYMSLIRAAGREKDMDRAFGVLHKLQQSGVSIDIAAYNSVLDVCVSVGDIARGRQLMQEMSRNGALDIITYNTLMKGYCYTNDLVGAKALLVEMKEAGFPPNDVSFNCIINAAASHGTDGLGQAWDVLETMEASGVSVDHYTLSIMLKSLKKARNPADVNRVLSLLDRSGLDVCSDEVLLNTVLDTCIRHRECRRLEVILEAVAVSNLRPSVHTYGSLIKACSTLQRLSQCWELWGQMENYCGVQPNEIVLGCMLDALVTNSHVEDAFTLFNKWKLKVPPNTVLISTVIKGFAATRQPDRAMELWMEMRERGIKMNTVVYNAVIDAQARVGAMENLTKVVETMQIEGCAMDSISYSTIVKGYCFKGDLDKAFEVFRTMQKGQLAKDSIVYNTILDGCTRCSRFDLADQLMADMEKFKIIPTNFTLGILVKMYGRRKQLENAFEVVESLPLRFRFTANTQVWTCLMCACINNAAFARAFEVFEWLKATATGPDMKAYNALITGCVRHGHFAEAISLCDEVYIPGSAGGQPKSARSAQIARELGQAPLEQLFRALSQRGLVDKLGTPLLERLRAAKIPLGGKVFSSAMSATPSPYHQRRG